MSKKERKPYEATERTFNHEKVKKAEAFLKYIVTLPDEELQDEKMLEKYRKAILMATRLVCCEAVGLKPSAIEYHYVEEGEEGENGNTCMSFGRANRIAESKGCYGVVMIYPRMQNTKNLVEFMAILLHEFVHISQHRLRESGKFVPKSIGDCGPDASLFEMFKYYIEYFANFCELDANVTSSLILLKWLKREEARQNLSKKELAKRRTFLRGKIAFSTWNYATGNCSKALLYTLCSPYLLYKAIKENVYRTNDGRDLDVVDSDISWNSLLGRRSKAVADRFVGRMLTKKEISADKRNKMVDLMIVQYASSRGIDPKRLGVVYSHPSVHIEDVRFIDAYDYEKNPKTFGYIELDHSVLNIDNPELISGLVEFALDKLDQDPKFLKALKREHKRNQKSATTTAGGEM